ncbi:hypothetical protein BC826DRAFT_1056284 [Russula brevipes]|nr:hypothetical protein BC826DRAFT_1056284 [Russula brevipes]
MPPLLTLDPSTLFYWSLRYASPKKRKYTSSIEEWAVAVPATAKPTLNSPSSLTNSDIPPLTSSSVKVNSELAVAHPLYVDGAINSPSRKRRKRVTSDVTIIIQKPSTAGETAAKAPRNDGFPHGVEAQWFRHRYTFISTYVAFVGQTANPCDVPVEEAVRVMQMIWNATTDYEYEITPSTGVYQKTPGAMYGIHQHCGRLGILHFQETIPGFR